MLQAVIGDRMPIVTIKDIEPGTTITIMCDTIHTLVEDPDPGEEYIQTKSKKVKLVSNGNSNG